MNPLQLAGRYLQGKGSNRVFQTAADYAQGALLGAASQQVMNWVTPGADPNPLLSGALFAPLGAMAVRYNRGVKNVLNGRTSTLTRDAGLVQQQLNNPIEKAALIGSSVGALGGAATSIYNVATDGTDYDNNLISAGVGTLGAIAPIAYSLIKGKSKPMVNESIGNSRSPINPKTGYQGVSEAVKSPNSDFSDLMKGYNGLSAELDSIKNYWETGSLGSSRSTPLNPKTGYYG